MNELKNYLDPKVLGNIQWLDLMARLVVEGFMSGMHRSPFHGYAVEFAQHREYVPGDDIKHIDWKVWSKTDRYFIKQYEEETNLKATFLLDVSESMRYASAARRGGLGKLHYAACVAASLSLLLLNQQDAVGLATFDEEVREFVAPSANPSQLKRLVHAMEAARSARGRGKTSLEAVCGKLAETLPRRGLIGIVSDLFVEAEDLRRGLQHLRHRGHEVMVLHVMDEDELTFPFEGNMQFEGLEGAGRTVANGRALRAGYLAAVERFRSEVKRTCAAGEAAYGLVSTADHLDGAIGSFLQARRSAARKISAKR